MRVSQTGTQKKAKYESLAAGKIRRRPRRRGEVRGRRRSARRRTTKTRRYAEVTGSTLRARREPQTANRCRRETPPLGKRKSRAARPPRGRPGGAAGSEETPKGSANGGDEGGEENRRGREARRAPQVAGGEVPPAKGGKGRVSWAGGVVAQPKQIWIWCRWRSQLTKSAICCRLVHNTAGPAEASEKRSKWNQRRVIRRRSGRGRGPGLEPGRQEPAPEGGKRRAEEEQ